MKGYRFERGVSWSSLMMERGLRLVRIRTRIRFCGMSIHTCYFGKRLISRLETLNGLIGKIPSNPLWAELLAAQKREEDAASASATLLPNGTRTVVRKVGSSSSLKSKRSASGIPRSTSGLKKKEKAK